MAAPPNESPAPLAHSDNRARRTDQAGNQIESEDNPSALKRKLEIARQRLDRFTDDLAQIADWRDDIARRVWRAQARFEFVDAFDRDEEDRLAEEVHDWRTVCNALAPYAEAGS